MIEDHYFRGLSGTEVTKRRAFCLLMGLIIINLIAWFWALVEFSDNTVLMGMAFLAYSFGLRHAVDADHIAAIDNVTRKMMQEGMAPIGVGAFFSLGHSTIVILATLAIVITTFSFRDDIVTFKETGGMIGTIVSATFLLIFSIINLIILISVYKKFRKVKSGQYYNREELDLDVANYGGFFSRVFRRLFNLVNKSWHMYPVGFLFGLGFDTATEIGILGISAASASDGMNLWVIMVFPFLFAAGMALIDSLDNFVMIGAYGWAFSKPIRKLYYNITITAASVVIALFIGGVESLSLVAEKMKLTGGVWGGINNLSENLSNMGFWIIGMFIFCWLVSAINYYLRGYDKLSIHR